MEVFKILDPGPFATIQDRGRFGYQRYGMPPAGVMDEPAFILGNTLLGNESNAAAIEFTLKGPTIEVLNELKASITGGICKFFVNGALQPLYAPVDLFPGDRVNFSLISEGIRGYLCISGGVDAPQVMGSRATYLRGRVGGIAGRNLEKGDIVHLRSNQTHNECAPLPSKKWPRYSPPFQVDVIMGPQDDYFTGEAINTFLNRDFKISEAADRMGYRLEGPEIVHKETSDIISDGIPLGGIQVPGHGQPIIMMKDRQTTGGYPKIATAASYDIYKLGQAKPGDIVNFNKVTLEEAEKRKKHIDNWLNNLIETIEKPVRSKSTFKIHIAQKSYKVTIRELNASQ